MGTFRKCYDKGLAPLGLSYTSYTDSAAAGTALMSGRKTSVERINTDWTGEFQFETIADLAMKDGLSAGVVASVMASHATPAAAIANNRSRYNYAETFEEMIEIGLTVIMGVGHPNFDSNGGPIMAEQDKDYQYVGGVETFEKIRSTQSEQQFEFIDKKAQFETLAQGVDMPHRVIGIAQSGSTLQANRSRPGNSDTESGVE